MWVRTQSRKGLFNVTTISIFSRDGNHRIYADGNNFEDYILGNYPTERRALEVLDEIQATLIKILKDADNKHEIVYVYEMPKD